MKYTFMYEHNDGSHGYYFQADSRRDADQLFESRCAKEEIPVDEYGLVRICKGGMDGEWLWDIYTGEPMPQEFWFQQPQGE